MNRRLREFNENEVGVVVGTTFDRPGVFTHTWETRPKRAGDVYGFADELSGHSMPRSIRVRVSIESTCRRVK